MIFKPRGLLGNYDFSVSRNLEKLVNGLLAAWYWLAARVRKGRGEGIG
jgi:hypothetical protein